LRTMTTRLLTIAALLTFLTTAAFAQQSRVSSLQKQRLLEIKENSDKDFKAKKQAAEAYAKANGIPMRQVLPDGRVIELQYLDENNRPVYLATDSNAGAANTISASRVLPGGANGLYLTGHGLEVGVWDGGIIRSTHVEFDGRVRKGNDSPSGLSNHATHVAGTIAAAGVNPTARGMAPKVGIVGYDFGNDVSEMSNEAAQGMILSNHSYGLVLGWSFNGGWSWLGDPDISTAADYRFGLYTSLAASFDNITYNAPYYLVMKSSGNDRNDTGPGGGQFPPDPEFGSIGPRATAKNIITVGAVSVINAPGGYDGPGSVSISGFSGFGPTDDGRIKPDLVASGVNIVSTGSSGDSGYSTLSGTSMSTPSAAGGLILLQELYQKLHNDEIMLSATLKAVAIHTTREAGVFEGPDFRHGWGLLAVDRGAYVLLNQDEEEYFVKEETLLDGETYELSFEYSGNGPIRATLVYTDLPGSPPPASLDPTDLMIVNDLDLRIFGPDGTEYFPYAPDPTRPGLAPAKGDNFRDNVERVDIAEGMPAGTYRAVVTHKGTLIDQNPTDGSLFQNFSLVVTSNVIEDPTRVFYWVDGNGDWNDPAHWSDRSGGGPINEVPGANDRVIIDDNSFEDQGGAISVGANSMVKGLSIFTEDVPFELMLNNNELTVNSGFFVEGESAAIKNGTVKLVGSEYIVNDISLNGADLSTANLMLAGNNTTWNLQSEAKLQSLTLSGGSLNTQGNTFEVAQISSAGSQSGTIDFGASRIEGLTSLDLANTDLSYDLSNATLVFNGQAEAYTLNAEGEEIAAIDLSSGSMLTITGTDNNLGNIIVQRQAVVQFMDDNNVTDLDLQAQSQLQIAANKTVTISGQMLISSSADNLVTIEGIDGIGNLESNNERRFCLDHLSINNVTTSGQTQFVAGLNSTSEGTVTGWILDDCVNLLYADFVSNYTCAGGITEFNDISSGSPETWQWSVGPEGGNLENAGTDPNLVFSFDTPGVYQVSLQITKNSGQDSNTFIAFINVPESNGLSKPGIIQDGERLFVTVTANNYQWYFNGDTLANQNSNFIDIGEEGGEYTVDVWGETCKFRSDPFLISGSAEIEALRNASNVYPNPMTESFTVSVQNDYVGPVAIKLVDALGKEVHTATGYKSGYQFSTGIEANNWPKGIYHCLITADGVTIAKRLIKQ